MMEKFADDLWAYPRRAGLLDDHEDRCKASCTPRQEKQSASTYRNKPSIATRMRHNDGIIVQIDLAYLYSDRFNFCKIFIFGGISVCYFGGGRGLPVFGSLYLWLVQEVPARSWHARRLDYTVRR